MPAIHEQPDVESPLDIPLTGDGSTAVEERRASGRIRTELPAQLVRIGATRTVQATATDIGAGGLFVRVPGVSKVVVGQRYEVVLSDEGAEALELSRFMGEGCFATVVRTERLAEDSQSTVGAGLRFDHPLMFWEAASAVAS